MKETRGIFLNLGDLDGVAAELAASKTSGAICDELSLCDLVYGLADRIVRVYDPRDWAGQVLLVLDEIEGQAEPADYKLFLQELRGHITRLLTSGVR